MPVVWEKTLTSHALYPTVFLHFPFTVDVASLLSKNGDLKDKFVHSVNVIDVLSSMGGFEKCASPNNQAD